MAPRSTLCMAATAPGAIHARCEDYRAAATIDLEHDRATRAAGDKVECPLRVFWGAEGVIERCFKPLSIWEEYAESVGGRAFQSGHYIPEQAPQLLLEHLPAFFG